MSGMTSWHEERRQDRLTSAQIEREREAARAKDRIAQAQAQARLQREERQARATARQQARKARAARRAARGLWLRAHTVDALFVPVIVVPAVLAWTAMAAYGRLIYGPLGFALPAFSEGAMWAFAAATTITSRRHPERPVWHLRAGTVLFAGVAAALNFAHAVTRLHGAPPPPGPVTGVVYAMVSVAGVTVHQLVTAGPCRSRAERQAARTARAARRREASARRAALRGAVARLGEDGSARLVFEPGVAEVARRWGRVTLTPVQGAADAPMLPLPAAGPVSPWPRPAPVLASAPDASQDAAEPPAVTSAPRQVATSETASAPRQQQARKHVSAAQQKRVKVRSLLTQKPALSLDLVARRAGVSRSTVDRVKADMTREQKDPRRLHVADG
jgi:hypothetical protein